MYESNASSGQHSAGNYGTSKLEQSTVGMNGAIEAARVWRSKKMDGRHCSEKKGSIRLGGLGSEATCTTVMVHTKSWLDAIRQSARLFTTVHIQEAARYRRS